MTNFECWISGLTEAQMWHYIYQKESNINCPLVRTCNISPKSCGNDECWQRFKEWAKTPVAVKETKK